ncbi:MAG: aminotransferase class III-fold pyridoxal phosphate-dependent enzyme, partial [Thermoanaerobaculia bacterium]
TLSPQSGERGLTGPIVDVRGSGLMWGIELDRPAAPVARELLAHGFVVGTAREKVLRLLPPYIVPKKALSEFIDALQLVLSATTEKAA